MLIDWYVRSFRKVINVLCILGLILVPLAGFLICGSAFRSYRSDFNGIMAFLGLIGGFIVEFILQFITIPPLMVLFTIDEKLDSIKKNNKLEDNINSSDNATVNTNPVNKFLNLENDSSNN